MRRAFTIVELIVVMAVVALLLGLLLPALANVGAGGRSMKCQLNLRQMATAALSYAAMFDAYPMARRYHGNKHISWDYVSVGNQVVSPGALWNFCTNPGEALQCPDYHGPANAGEEFTGYNYNTSYIGGEEFQFPGGSDVRPGIPPHACNRGAKCAMFGDAGRKNGSNRYMRAPSRTMEGLAVPWSVIYSGGQAFRHSQQTNIAFVDGHVGPWNKLHKGQSATENLLSTYLDYPKNGFLSDDDRAYDPR